MLQCIKLEQFLPNFTLTVQKAQASRGVWRTAPVILHFYGFIAKNSVAPASKKSSLPNDIHQWKRTHQNRNEWAAHPRQGWFTLLALKYFTCFSISSWEFPTSSFRASISCVKAFSMTKQDKGWTMETQKKATKNGCYKLITVECQAVTNKCGRGIDTERKAGIAQRYLNSLLLACYFEDFSL